MNRVVLIGNGYDLSIGLKTRYEDFLVDYFNRCMAKSMKGLYEDHLIRVYHNSVNHHGRSFSFKFPTSIRDLKSHQHILLIPSESNSSPSSYQPSFEINLSKLLQQLLLEKAWTDIEATYFNLIIDLYENNSSESRSELLSLNRQFETLKKELRSYLINEQELEIDKIKDLENLSKIAFLYHSLVLDSDIENQLFYKPIFSSWKIEKVLYINFNYTSTLSQQIELFKEANFAHIDDIIDHDILHIHGTLEEDENIIFGYGDENHKSYETIEESEQIDYLLNIKSFHYALNNRYRKIMNFIVEDDYEVFSVGHSLGISDRTLLKTIFDNEKCKKIRLFHRGNENSFFKKVIALSKHFSSNADMRRKLLAYDKKDIV